MPDPNFTTEHIADDFYVMRNWGDWLPVRKTREGNLAFISSSARPDLKADGTKERAIEIIRKVQAEEQEYYKQHPKEARRKGRRNPGDSKRFTYRGNRFEVWKGNDNEGKLGYDPWFFRPVKGPAVSRVNWHVMGPSKSRDDAVALAKYAADMAQSRVNPARMPGEPDEAKLLAKARKPGNNIRTMAKIQQQAHDWGLYSVTAAVHDWMQRVGATQEEMEQYWKRSNPGKGWFTRCIEGVSASGSAVDPGAVCGAQLKRMGYRRRNPVFKPKGFKTESSGTLWYKEYVSLRAAEKKLQELLHEGYRANINFLNGKHRVRVGMDDGPGYDESKNPRGGRLTPSEARSLLGRAGVDVGEDFFVLSGSQVERLLQLAKEQNYKKSRSAPGSTARMFHEYLQRTASRRENRRRTRNAGPWSIRKHKKSLKKSGSGTNWQPGIRVTHPRRKPRGMTNPTAGGSKVFIVRTAATQFLPAHELTIRAKTKRTARAEASDWYRRQSGGMKVPKLTIIEQKQNAGPSSIRKMKKLFHETKAQLATHWPTKESLASFRSGFKRQRKYRKSLRQRNSSGTAETLLYNKYRRQGYSAAEAERLAKLNAPYYQRGRRRNRRSVSMLVPRSTRRTIKAIERRTTRALSKYLGGRS